ncbi:MAG: LysM peptidoglycan-binding domain-containing protein [Cystobacterineae bacterium]|nr:LysM peptidoglycan-binding domain-containing protein [Cystobacterineae bacterium]
MKHCLGAFFIGILLSFSVQAQNTFSSQEGGVQTLPEGGIHKVAEGDTLWSLAETYLGDSAEWLGLWAANEQIENPNWIYPGEVVYLKPPLPADESPVVEPPNTPQPNRLIERPADLPSLIAVDTLITPEPIEGWGSIESSISQSEMLSPLDDIHIKLKQESRAQAGETFLIFRKQGKLKHPKTGEFLGHVSTVVGAARLYSREGQHAMAKIIRANAEVLRGDMLGPMGESNIRPVYMRKNEKNMEGWVVATEPLASTMAGIQYLIFVDKGAADGVVPGNRFHIMRQQDGLSLQTVLSPATTDEELPKQAIGFCTIIDVKSKVSCCLLIHASREIVPGDKVEMRNES